ncbi:MAG: hypothetical protein WAQ28_18820 [Bacteroidia bacterium]
MKRQIGDIDCTSPNHQTVNSINRQVVDALPIDIEKLRQELVAFAEVAIQNKLDELVKTITTSIPENVNHLNSVKVNSDASDNKQTFVMEFPDDDNEYINEENGTLIKDHPVKPSTSRVDGLKKRISKPETVQFNSLSIEKEDYKPVKCKWINELYERFNERGNGEKFNSPASVFQDKANQVAWVSIHYRCLLECLITVSEIKTVEWNDLAELTNAFTFLIASDYFKELPGNYPYRKEIISLRDKLNHFCLETQEEDYVPFRLKFDTKKELFLQRFELSLAFPKITFKQLQLDFKNENDKYVQEVKKEQEVKQPMKERLWLKNFRKMKLNSQSAKRYDE